MLEHPGDIMIRAIGKDVAELFANMSKGMMAFLYGEEAVQQFVGDKREVIELKADDRESLFVDWLSELLFLSNTNYRLYGEVKVLELNDQHVKTEVSSCPAQAVDDIKAVTYHGLKIEEKEGQWEAVVVFDI